MTYEIFKKYDLNFYDFLNITKDELSEFKVPIKEKIRAIKLNSNLKKFLEENCLENDLIATSNKISDCKNYELLVKFFLENKLLIYNHKYLENFISEEMFKTKPFQKLKESNTANSCLIRPNTNVSNSEHHNLAHYHNSSEEKLHDSNYITTPNFRNISQRKTMNNNFNNCNYFAGIQNQEHHPVEPKININANEINYDRNNNVNNNINSSSNYHSEMGQEEKLKNVNHERSKSNNRVPTNLLLDNYNQAAQIFSNINNNSFISNNKKVNSHLLSQAHQTEIMELMRNNNANKIQENYYETQKNNTNLSDFNNQAKENKSACIMDKAFNSTQQTSGLNTPFNNYSNYESYRNEYEKIIKLNSNYNNIYQNNPDASQSNINFSQDQNSNFCQYSNGESFMKYKNFSDKTINNFEADPNQQHYLNNASSIKQNNPDSNKEINSFLKISNFSSNQMNSNILHGNNKSTAALLNAEIQGFDNYNNNNNNINNQDNCSNYNNKINNNNNNNNLVSNSIRTTDNMKEEQSENFKNKKNNSKNFSLEYYKNGENSKQEIFKNHETFQMQKLLLEKISDNKTKSKIKVKKNSFKYNLGSSNSSSININQTINNYFTEYKVLKERSENRQIKFNKLLKNCQRLINRENINSFNMNSEGQRDSSSNRIDNESQLNSKSNNNNNNKLSTEDEREELLLNQELNILFSELNINSEAFRVTEHNIEKLKRIKYITEFLKANNKNIELELDFDLEEIEKQIVIFLFNKN